MKKFIKSISMFCLALVMLVPAFALAGCSKKYTITVSVESGEGVVLKQSIIDTDGKNYVGKNTVEEGEKFEYFVRPSTFYEIDKVVVNGEEIEVTDRAGFYPVIESVEKNYTIKVYFKIKKVTVKFACESGIDEIATVKYDANASINLGAEMFGNANLWRAKLSDGSDVASLPTVLSLTGCDVTIYTTLTRAQLAENGINVSAISALAN